MKRIITVISLLLAVAVQGLALDIQKGTYYFDNSLTRYPVVKFVYGSNSPAVTRVVSMTDEGGDRWSVTFDEAVTGIYRYVVAATSMADGTYQQSFTEVKDYISQTLDEPRTITSDNPMPVGWIYTPTDNEKWASAEWRMPYDQAYSGTLPVLFIKTDAPVTSKETYVGATCYIDALGLEGYTSLGTADEPLTLQVKGRGNWTWKDFAKKPYRLKFNEKVKPLGMRKSRHFVLMACADDNLGFLRNTVGLELSRRLSLAYTPWQEPVEVVLNGDYIGLYMLTEKIRVATKRVNIVEQADLETDPDSITGGWLFEIDNYDEDGQVVITEGNGQKLRFTMHTPEVLSGEQRSYITGLLTATDRAIYASDKRSTGWEQYIDIDSLVRYYIVQEVMDDAESFHGSCYIHKERGDDTKLIFGPVWDFGNAFQRGYDRFIYQDPPFGQSWIGEIARFPRFQERVKEVWRPFLGRQYPGLDEYIDRFIARIATASLCDARRWPSYGTTNIEERKSEFKRRMGEKVAFLTRQWGEGIDFVWGDVNGDGTVDVADISAIISVMAGNGQPSIADDPYSSADVNGDGAVNVADVSAVISIMTTAAPDAKGRKNPHTL